MVGIFPGISKFFYFIQEWNKGTHGSQSSKDSLFSPKFYWVEIWRRDELVSVVLTQVSMYLSVSVMSPRKRPLFRIREIRRK